MIALIFLELNYLDIVVTKSYMTEQRNMFHLTYNEMKF